VLTLPLSPHRHLRLVEAPDAAPLDDAVAARLRDAFARGTGNGLLQLGAAEVTTALPVVLAFWRDVGAQNVTAACSVPARPSTPSHRPTRAPWPPSSRPRRR
jgi:non-specific serine/threonine protein kinase